jgi:hypothetical protein
MSRIRTLRSSLALDPNRRRSIVRPDVFLNRYVGALRLDGHSHDAIAFALAEGAVDTLVAAGFSGPALDSGMRLLIEAMRDRALELRALSAAPPLKLVACNPSVATARQD